MENLYSNHTDAVVVFSHATSNESLIILPTELYEANVTSQCALRKTTENFIVTIAFTIIFCLSVVGNSVVIVTIVQQRTMRTITNLYLVASRSSTTRV